MTTKYFVIFGIFNLLVQLTVQLPVKESSSTEKAPAEGADSQGPNLENVIGKF
jgi:hypothetical protein